IRSAAALIDVSPLYKYRIAGPGAAALANRVVTRDVEKLEVGQVYYTPWCDPAGKVRDDGTLQRLAASDFRLTSAEPTLLWLEENAVGLDVTVTDESDAVGALALQGPTSRDVLREIAEAEVDGLGFFRLVETRIGGVPVELTRTGYTGDLGYEIWVRAEDAVRLWDAVVEAGDRFGLAPAGMLALDMARVEAGLLLVDVDYVPAHRALIELRKSSPFELGLGWTVARGGASYVGRAALEAEREREPAWRLRGLEVDWDSIEAAFAEVDLPPEVPAMALRDSVPVYAGGVQAGYATSRTWSPTVKKLIALAHLRARWAAAGTELEIELTVEHRRRRALARVVDTPFYDPERKRA
ncbi:MAG: aminomethyltransferase family protein, partial [Gemmatimonadota bacterium]|nr:aminomethyltransferase family protein [Gemmatimonadota bacterium]